MVFIFFFNDTATTEIYTLSLHDALPICNSSVENFVASFRPGLTHAVHGSHGFLGLSSHRFALRRELPDGNGLGARDTHSGRLQPGLRHSGRRSLWSGRRPSTKLRQD